MPTAHESVFDIGKRLTALIQEAEHEAVGEQLSESFRERLADAVESFRLRVMRKPDRDPRSLFDLDERLIDLMDRAEEAAQTGDIPEDLLHEINDYIEAFRTKVDRISGDWRWPGLFAHGRSRRNSSLIFAARRLSGCRQERRRPKGE